MVTAAMFWKSPFAPSFAKSIFCAVSLRTMVSDALSANHFPRP
jgi:hypothetical protein